MLQKWRNVVPRPDKNVLAQVPGRLISETEASLGFNDGNNMPQGMISFDEGRRIMYLRTGNDSTKHDLWEMDLQTKKENILLRAESIEDPKSEMSEAERVKNEAKRQWTQGISSFTLDERERFVFIPLPGGRVTLLILSDRSIEHIELGVDVDDRVLSPLGNYISYVKNKNLYYMNLATKEHVQVTTDGGKSISNGVAEYIAQEELSRYKGHWWSPDETKIAFTKCDDTSVDMLTRIDIDEQGEVKTTDFKYPKAGRPNVLVSVHCYDIQKKTSAILTDDCLGKEIYVARVKWFTDTMLNIIILNRHQTRLSVFRAIWNPVRTVMCVIRYERSNTYLTPPDDHEFGYLPNAEWAYYLNTEKGDPVIDLYDVWNDECRLLTQISIENGRLDSLISVNESEMDGWIRCFVSYRACTSSGPVNPLEKRIGYFERRICDADDPEHISLKVNPITPEGYSAMALPPDGTGSFAFKLSSILQPPSIYWVENRRDNLPNYQTPSMSDLCSIHVFPLIKNVINASHPLSSLITKMRFPDVGCFKASDNKTLYYRLLKPFNFDPTKKYPVFVYVYGGPSAQIVQNAWSRRESMFQYLAQKGYIVFSLDNRGAAGYGKVFEETIYRKMSQLEVDDQCAGVDFLSNLSYVDPERIGVYGHSYGGYMALMLLFRSNGKFKIAVSGAPVTDWALYDTCYTERYMGEPKDNEEGYKNGDVLQYVDGYDDTKQSLLIYHGTSDNNVIYANSIKLYKDLQLKGKLYESVDYPGVMHSMQGDGVACHFTRTIINFFDRKFMMSR